MFEKKKNVLVVGSGGVGTIVAYGIFKTGKSNVTLLARSNYESILNNGINIRSCDYGEFNYKPKVIQCIDSDEYYDYLVVTTKNQPDIITVEKIILPAIKFGTVIVLIQNGIDIEKSISETHMNIILSGVSMIKSTMFEDSVKHTGKDRNKIGYFPNSHFPEMKLIEECKKFIDIYSNSLNDITFDDNQRFTRWKKLIYNASWNPICALTRLNTQQLHDLNLIESLVRPLMMEVIKIAKLDGYIIPTDVCDEMLGYGAVEPYKPSMLVDLINGKYTEVEVICGNIVRIAENNQVAAPNLNIVYQLLRSIQLKSKIN